MKIVLLMLTGIFCFGSIWFGRLAYIAGQGTGTGYLGEIYMYGLITIICILIAIGLGIWAILS